MEYPLKFVEFLCNEMEADVFIIGGSASYLHILDKLEIEVDIKDIDFSIYNRKEIEEVSYNEDEEVSYNEDQEVEEPQDIEELYNRMAEKHEAEKHEAEKVYNEMIEKLNSFCASNGLSYSIILDREDDRFSVGYIQLAKDKMEYMKLNYFINEENLPYERINNLNVLKLEKTLQNEEYYLDLALEITSNEQPYEQEEYEMFLDKLPRKQRNVELLKKCI